MMTSPINYETIWKNLCGWIVEQLHKKKNVKLSKLGIMFLLNIDGKEIKPSFRFSESLMRSAQLREKKQFPQLLSNAHLVKTNCVELNFSAIADRSHCERDIVELFYRKQIQTFIKTMFEEKKSSLEFHNIGRMIKKHNKIMFIFNDDFFRNFICYEIDKKTSTSKSVDLTLIGQQSRISVTADGNRIPNESPIKFHRPNSSILLNKSIDSSNLTPIENKMILSHYHRRTSSNFSNSSNHHLCPNCHTKNSRNVPNFTKNHKLKRLESEEDKLLLQKSLLEAQNFYENNKRKQLQQREKMKEVQNYNYETMMQQKLNKKSSTQLQNENNNFFPRNLSNVSATKRKQFAAQLATQIDFVTSRRKEKEKLDKERQEEERRQLTQQLIEDRNRNIQKKMEMQKNLRSELDVQIKNGREILPKILEDLSSDFFDKYRTEKEDAMKKKRLELLDLAKEQKAEIDRKQNRRILEKQRQMEIELEQRERLNESRMKERSENIQKELDYRRDLQQSWLDAINEKNARENKEKFQNTNQELSSIVVHDQLASYPRCHQCKRSIRNKGQTNVWKDTQRPAGNRLFI
ncbi:hypothetical protein SNEBB_010143 [Seison nebaliae]|nr:hypothetical protein SNEBB_010143 [Seison nebaliae]